MQYSFSSAALGALASVVILSNMCNAAAIPQAQGLAARFESVSTSASIDSLPTADSTDFSSLETRAVAVGGPGIKVTVKPDSIVNVKAGTRVLGGTTGGKYTVDSGKTVFTIKAGEQKMAGLEIIARAVAVGGPGIKVTVKPESVVNVKAGTRVLGGTIGGKYTVDGGKTVFTIKAGEQKMAGLEIIARAVGFGGPGIKITVQPKSITVVQIGTIVLGGTTGGKYSVEGSKKTFTIKAGEQQTAAVDLVTRAVGFGGPGVKVTVQPKSITVVQVGTIVLGGTAGGKYSVEGSKKTFTIKAGEQQTAAIDLVTRAVGFGGPGVKVTVQPKSITVVQVGTIVLGGTAGGQYAVEGSKKTFTIKAGEQQTAAV